MLQEHRRLKEIAAFFGKSPESVKKKINRLGLVVVVLQIPKTTTTNDLPRVEGVPPLPTPSFRHSSLSKRTALTKQKTQSSKRTHFYLVRKSFKQNVSNKLKGIFNDKNNKEY
jgi:hypothetical protein